MHIQIENNFKLWVEGSGINKNETVVCISGAGAGATFWSERMHNTLTEKGFFVICYDHRDFGYSDKIDFDKNPYDMMDLTRDAIAILNAFEVEKAHIVGHSMGGFIAQLMAIHFPERVLSITSASSSTNSPEVPEPRDKTWEIFMNNKPVNDFEKDLKGFLIVWEYLNGTAEFDQKMAIDYTRKLYERQDIKGPLGESHVKAQASLTDRSEDLKQIDIPALIIHGKEDYLVDPYGGIQTAECIRNSQFVMIPEMGHIPFNREILKRMESEIIQHITDNKKINLI